MSRILSLAVATFLGCTGIALAQQTPSYRQPSPPMTAPSQTNRAQPSTQPAGAYASETEAKSRCGSDMVVWANEKSHVYHFTGTANYGHTKEGAYMCRAEADRSGFRAAGNEKAPTTGR